MFRTENRVTVEASNPYARDWLDRKDWVKELAADMHGSDGGVLGLRGGVGTGKTTIMRMLEAELNDSGKRTVYVDLWKSDFVDSAFVALTAGVLEGLPEARRDEIRREGNRLASRFSEWKEPIRGLLKAGLSAARLKYGMDDGSELDGITIDAAIETADATIKGGRKNRDAAPTDEERIREFDGRRIERYAETVARMEAFRNALERATESDGSPDGMVLLIDELDRCRPSYAVEVLEVAKHLFQVPNIVFVIAFNSGALEASMQHAYGQQFPAREYLDRFFDLTIDISSGNVGQYIQKQIREMGLGNHFGMTGPTHRLPGGVVNGILAEALHERGGDLRRIKKALHQIDLIWTRMGTDGTRFPEMLATLMLLRIKDESMYVRFLEGNATDRDVIELVMDGTEPPKTSEEGRRNFFACIMCAAKAIGVRTKKDVSPLYCEYVRGHSDSNVNPDQGETDSQRRQLVVGRVTELELAMGEAQHSRLWAAAASINLHLVRS